MPNLEPGPVAKKRRRRASPKPEQFEDAMVSLNEGLPKSARFSTLEEAKGYKKGIDAAVYWIRRWGAQELGGDPQRYNVRGNPFISEHYVIDGLEYDVEDQDLSAADVKDASDHYWRTNFYLRQPEGRGMAVIPRDKMREIQQKGIDKKKAAAADRREKAEAAAYAANPDHASSPARKRTVAVRGD